MEKSPNIEIIILNYCGWEDTIECLESILRSDYLNYQVIVVDNNSPNNSMEYIKAWAEGKQENIFPEPSHPLYHLSHPSIKKPIPYVFYSRDEAEKGGDKNLENIITKQWQEERNLYKDELISTSNYPLIFIQTGKNLGFAGGNNVGIKYALEKNDFDNVILLNNDTAIDKKTISELMNARNNFGDEAIYGSRIYYYSDPHKIWYDGGHFNEWYGKATHTNIGKTNTKLEPIHTTNFITFCCVLIPKKIFKKIGLLDESYFMYVEDLDYSYRVRKNGYILYHVSSSQLWHKIGASSGKETSEFSIYWYYKNSLKFKKKLPAHKKFIALFLTMMSRTYFFFKYIFYNKNIAYSIFKSTRDEIIRR